MRRSRLAWSYLLATGLIWLLGDRVGERTVPTLLLAYAPPLLWLLPAPAVLAWTLFRRRGVAVALAGTLLAAWGAGLLHWRPQHNGGLRVVTYNIAGGKRTSGLELGTALRMLDADVVLLQESRDLSPRFRTDLGRRLPGYAAIQAAEVTTLTRLPVRGVSRVSLPQSGRQALVTRLEWRGGPLTVINAHPGTVLLSPLLRGDLGTVRRTRQVREAQMRALLDVARRVDGPLILGGDLNTPPRGLIYRQFQTLGADAHDAAGRGPGWTFPGFFARIDHLFSRGLTPTRSRAPAWPLSDHRPLIVDY